MGKDLNGVGEGGGAAGYNRPRRPNGETIAYLRGLPLDIETAKSEIAAFFEDGEKNDDFPQSLAAAISAVDEVRLEIASLAGDELASQSIEILAHITAPYSETAARVLLSACSGYHLHLATHRYASHVVQTILQLAVSSSSKTDLALHSESPQFGDYVASLPSLSELIHGMVEELSVTSTQLAIHVCGSHVLRSLFCVLGGVNLVSSVHSNANKVESGTNLRGRKKSKKKKRKPPGDDSLTSAPHAGTMQVVCMRDSRVRADEFREELESLTLALLGERSHTPGELQQLACHPSAGPLLIILLRVLTHASQKSENVMRNKASDEQSAIADFRLGVSPPEPTFAADSLASDMAKRLLCWNDNDEEQKQVGEVIYGYSGEPRGSHVLETLLRLSPDEMHEAIIKYGDFENPDSLQDYSEHEVSNFVIQTLLTTVRSKEQAERILKAIEKVISGGLAIDPLKKRRGILWRSCEMAAKYRVGQETLLKAIRLGFGATVATSDQIEKLEPSIDGKQKKQRRKATALEIKDCMPLLIGLKKSQDDGERLIIDAAGARSIYHLLHFSPRLCQEVLAGILEGLKADELDLLSRDGLGSRCILDGILDGPGNAPEFASAFKALFAKLQGKWTSLATDRVGHHTVKKLFNALLKIDDKAKLVEELVAGGNRLNGNAMGRSVAEVCHIQAYRDSRKEWRKLITKSEHKETAFLEAMVQDVSVAKQNEEAQFKGKRKRKRKRASDDVVGDPTTPKNAQKVQIATDTIIKAMTVPSLAN